MPASTVTKHGIWNLALSRLGAKRVATAGEVTTPTLTETLALSDVYDFSLEQVLRSHAWPWANKKATLSASADTTWDGWAYRYTYPADCVNFLAIDDGNALRTARSKIPFKVIAKDDLSDGAILTDQQDAVGIYTALVTDVTVWDMTFITALSYLLAADVAFALNRPRSVKADMLQIYNQVLQTAQGDAFDEEGHDTLPDTSAVAARG